MYVYGVMRQDARLRLPREGVAGRPVGRVVHEDLAALVGEVGDEPIRASRRTVMAHSAVLQEVVARSADVLPMRFGVVMPGADAVRDELLAARGDALRTQLEEHAGRVELGVTVTSRQDAQLRSVMAADPALRAAVRRLQTAGYQERIAFGERVARGIEAERERVAGLLLDALGRVAVDAVVDEPRHEDMLASVALLVERGRVDEFDTELEALNDELGPERRVRSVGPLPPYHFVELEEAAAWA